MRSPAPIGAQSTCTLLDTGFHLPSSLLDYVTRRMDAAVLRDRIKATLDANTTNRQAAEADLKAV